MISKIFSRYNREMKEAHKKGDEARLLALASCSAALIAKIRHDLGQFYTLASRGGPGSYKKAVVRLRTLATVQEKELGLFTLFLFAARQRNAVAMNELLAVYGDLFLGKVNAVREPGSVPEAAWVVVLAPALGLGIDPAVVFPVAGHIKAAGNLLVALVAGETVVDGASWDPILAAAVKAGIEHSFLLKAAILLVRMGNPVLAMTTVERIDAKYYRLDSLKALIAALTAAGYEKEAFAEFLKTGKDGEIYQDELTMPILQNLMNKGDWPEAIGMVPKLPNETSRQDVLKMIIVRLAGQEVTKEETWELLASMIDSLHSYRDTAIRAKMIKGLARHRLYGAAIAQVHKLDSDKLRQDGMMLLMEQMREAGEAPEMIREMLKDFNAPEGMWNQPAQPPLPSITALLGEYLNESGFVNNLRRVSEIFGDFCGRPPTYKKLLEMGLEDEALEEALEMSRVDRKMTALAEIAQTLYKKGRAEEAETALQYGLQQCRELEHQGEKARSLAEIGLGLAGSGQTQAAQEVFSEAFALAQMIPENDHKVWPLDRIVVCETRAGLGERAREHLDLLLGIFNGPRIEEKEERLSDFIGELVEANAVDIAGHALSHFIKTVAADPDGDFSFRKLFSRLRRLKAVPGWLFLALISLSGEIEEKAASSMLWDARYLAIDKNQWDLAVAITMKMTEYEPGCSGYNFLQIMLLIADIPRQELLRLLETYGDILSVFPKEGAGWLTCFSLLLKAGLVEKAMDILQKKLGENINAQASLCEKELREMEEMIASSAGSPVSVVPWALSFRPASPPETGGGGNDEGEADQEHWNRLFSALIENEGMEERCGGLNAFFWNVPSEFAATFANILAYHPLLLRLQAIFALTRRAIAEQNRTCIRLAIPLAYDCRDGVEMCRLALKAIPKIDKSLA